MFGDDDGIPCHGILKESDDTHVKCNGTRKKSQDDIARRTTLFTLNHGEVGIVLLECKCSICSYLNRYRGYGHGIFSSARGTAYEV